MVNTSAPLLADMLKESMHQGYYPSLTVVSNSMMPLLRFGDQVSLEPVDSAQLQLGDIVTILDDCQLLTHRFWGIITQDDQEKLLTRGDRCLNFDRSWPVSRLVGRVVFRHRRAHVLPITTGLGCWLNKQLATLAAVEWRWLTGENSGQSHLPLSPSGMGRRRTLFARLIRYIFWACGIILANIVYVAANRRR